jgi:hypothetical protein
MASGRAVDVGDGEPTMTTEQGRTPSEETSELQFLREALTQAVQGMPAFFRDSFEGAAVIAVAVNEDNSLPALWSSSPSDDCPDRRRALPARVYASARTMDLADGGALHS